MRTAKETWEAAKGALQVQISKANFEAWLRDTVGLSHQGGQFIVGTPSAFAQEWLEKRLRSLVTKVLMSITGEELQVQFQVCLGREPSSSLRDSAASRLLPMINPQHTFDNFVVGASNRLAFAAAMAAAEGPGRGHNPLFIHGQPGVGKTHLAHAIANDASENGIRVVCASSEQFTNEFVNSLKERRIDEFRAKFRNTDLLVIDDIQFIVGKPQTQETLFHTFNELHDANCQLVVTSDRTPASLASVETGLWSRLGSGLVTEVEAPDLNTRLAILRARAAQLQAVIDDAVFEYIAQRCQRNVRELESSLNLVMAYAKLMRQNPTLQLAQQALHSLGTPGEPKAITPASILAAVAEHFQVSLDALKSRQRNHKVALARHIAIYLVREKTNCGLQDLGRLLGGRDHSTVLRGHQKIAGMIPSNPNLRKSIDEILATFAG
ncbi:MAG: chromosomal replication initiator protein DnaA [Dehalococcoidia bacterium]|nr:chromosomal replication initiator protein DnaA [Dehalococcoidia bacterium]